MGAARKPKPHYADLLSPSVTPADLAQGIGIANSLKPHELIRLAHDSGLKHIVQTSGMEFDRELLLARAIAAKPKDFLNHPLEMINGSNSAKSERRFSMNSDAAESKDRLIDSFAEFLAESSSTRRVLERAILIADELYTNGSKNAWPGNSGLFEGPATSKGTIEFFSAADESRLVIGCKDSFGKLSTKRLTARLLECFDKGVADSIRRGSGGAGIGSYLVFESSVSYYAGVQANKKTLVCVVLPIGARMREISESVKHVHLFSIK